MYTVLLVIHSIIVLFLIVMILIQRTDSDGMGGLSGSAGGNQFMTGRSAANLMTRTTAILAGVFMFTSLVLAVIASRMTSHSIIDSVPAQTQEAPAVPGPDAAAKDQAPAPQAEKKAPTAAKQKPAAASKDAAPAAEEPQAPKPE